MIIIIVNFIIDTILLVHASLKDHYNWNMCGPYLCPCTKFELSLWNNYCKLNYHSMNKQKTRISNHLSYRKIKEFFKFYFSISLYLWSYAKNFIMDPWKVTFKWNKSMFCCLNFGCHFIEGIFVYLFLFLICLISSLCLYFLFSKAVHKFVLQLQKLISFLS